jgi:hypothetical protein
MHYYIVAGASEDWEGVWIIYTLHEEGEGKNFTSTNLEKDLPASVYAKVCALHICPSGKNIDGVGRVYKHPNGEPFEFTIYGEE